MTFNEKIERYFSRVSIRLSNVPSRHLLHQFADYVELVSLFSNENFVTATDILDRFHDEGIIRKEDQQDEIRAESNDKDEQWVNEIFRVIGQRRILFEDAYPFEILDGDKIRLADASLTNRQKLYLYLLLASSLYLFGTFQPEITSEFEKVSYEALKHFLPPHAVVKSFGRNCEYSGTAVQKIRDLARDLKIEVDEKHLRKLSERGTQERGLDVIGWLQFEDTVANLLSILAQCACGKDWHKKLNETVRYENYYRFRGKKPVHALFIPYALINPQESDFYEGDEITNTLLFERKRILNYVMDDQFFDSLESKVLVEKCISFEEDIV